MREILSTLFYDPMLNLFVGLYDVIGDVGIVILVVTLLTKLILWPVTKKSIEAQRSLTDLQPKLEAIKEKYKGDQQKMTQETMLLYKEHKVNPLGSCLPLLIQLVISVALFYVLRDTLSGEAVEQLYPFVPNPGTINPITFGIFDLGKPNIVLGILAGVAQFWQSKMMSRKSPPKKAGEGAKDEGIAVMMNKQMLYFLPFMTALISIQFPAGLPLYWFLSTSLTAIQQLVLFKKTPHTGIIEGTIVEKK